MDLWDWSRQWNVLWTRNLHRIEVQLLRLAFQNVDSRPKFERPVVVPHIKWFAVLAIEFFVSPLPIRHLLMRLHQWGHQWWNLWNPSGNRASSFCFSTGGLSIKAEFSCFCQEMIEGVGWFLCLWQSFDFLITWVVVRNSLMVKCWAVVD